MSIPHCKPYFPPLTAYQAKVEEIWKNGWLTNQGPLVTEFEEKIASYFGLKHVSYVSSGTMGLQCALRALGEAGEIITTPYSYVATSSAIFWEGHKPVFADIDRRTLTVDPDKVEALITPKTRALLVTHVYGMPANIEELQAIATKHKIKLIFDAAHAFGTSYKGKSLLEYGDISVLSLHATKLFHTANGGLVICKNAADKKRIDSLKNFGHNGPNNFDGLGINGKNSELHAALGLVMLDHADEIVAKRRGQWDFYKSLLSGMDDQHFLKPDSDTRHNGAYFPIMGLERKQTDRILSIFGANKIEMRRYFNPSLNKIAYLNGTACPVSEALADTVFCLPIYHDLRKSEQEEIVSLLLSTI